MRTLLVLILVLNLFCFPLSLSAFNDNDDLLLGRMELLKSDSLLNYFVQDECNIKSVVSLGKKNYYPTILPPKMGVQRLNFAHLDIEKRMNLNYSYVIAGKRSYQIASMSGKYLRRGVLNGDETGVWSQPYKLLDGVLIELSVDNNPYVICNEADSFINRLYCAEIEQTYKDVRIVRREFAPDDYAAFCYRISLQNFGHERHLIRLRVSIQSNIRPIWKKSNLVNYGRDFIEQTSSGFYMVKDQYIDSLTVWVGSLSTQSGTSYINSDNPYRNRVIYEYCFELGSGSTEQFDYSALMYDLKKEEININGLNLPEQQMSYILHNNEKLMLEKKGMYDRIIAEGTRLETPDRNISDAFSLGIYNLQSLSSDIRPYLYDCHLMTCPERAYQALFGIDPMYAAMGAICVNMFDVIKSTIKNHLHYANEIDNIGINFIIDHWGDHPNSGARAQETTQFIGTVWEYLLFSGDKEFAQQIYPQMKELMINIALLDKDKDGWIEGMTFPRISRDTESEKDISAAVRYIWALRAMGDFAAFMKDFPYANEWREKADILANRFNKEWWRDEFSIWALGMFKNASGKNEPIRQIFYNQGSINYPQKYKIADLEKGRKAIETVWKNAVDEKDGYMGPAVTTWQSCNFALGCYNYDRPDLAIRLLRRAALNPTSLEKMLGAFSTINSDPDVPTSNSNKIMYNWSIGPFLESIVYGMFGIKVNGFNNTIVFAPKIPEEWNYCTLKNFCFAQNKLDFNFKNGRWTITLISVDSQVVFMVNNQTYILDETTPSISFDI